MNKTVFLFCIALLLFACSGDAVYVFRTSSGVATQDLNISVFAEVHTHLSADGEQEETHTTVQTEFSGNDTQGAPYRIELAADDHLSISVDGISKRVSGTPFPSAEEAYFMEYVADFAQTAPGTAFQVNMARGGQGHVDPLHFSLIDVTNFTATPGENSELALDENLTVEWLQAEPYHYRLSLRLRCFSPSDHTTFLPNSSTRDAVSPFTFSINELFSLPAQHNFSVCELHSTLHTARVLDLTSASDFKSAYCHIARKQSIKHAVTLL